jgi:hypothetical protein
MQRQKAYNGGNVTHEKNQREHKGSLGNNERRGSIVQNFFFRMTTTKEFLIFNLGANRIQQVSVMDQEHLLSG